MFISACSDSTLAPSAIFLWGRVKRNSEAQAPFLLCAAARTGKIFLHPDLSPGSRTTARYGVGHWPAQSSAGQPGCYGDSARSRAFTSSRARSPALDSQDSMVQNIARVAVAMASVANQPRSFHGVGRTRSFMSSGLEAATMTTIMIGTEITALITADQ